MSTNTTTPARKTPAKRTAPRPTPAPTQAAPVAEVTVDEVQASLDTTVTVADQIAARADEANQATTPATVGPVAYTIPAWDDNTDNAAYAAHVARSYQEADKPAKASMRAAWAKFQSDALNELNMRKLSLVRDVNAVLKSARPTAETADPADAYLIRINALSRAAHLLEVNFAESYGDDAWNTLRDRLVNEMTADEMVATDAMAAQLAAVKLGNRRTGPARSVEAHIKSALDAAPDGAILTCAQIHNHRSDAYGPDDSPSVGAVGAAHGREMDGIVSTENAAKTKGFKLA